MSALLALPLAVLAAHAWHTYWLCDDAFITFRYVRNFINGHGLVFNPGEYVEGYTNFLWLLEIAGLWKFATIRPEYSAILLSALYTLGTVIATATLAYRYPFPKRRLTLLWITLFLLSINRTFAVWCSSGLETRQFTFFVVLTVCFLVGRGAGTPRSLALASVALAFAELTRPEGLLLFGCCWVWQALESFRKGLRRALRDAALLAAPYVLIVGIHFAFRYWYYGEFFPNTYYAKYVRPWTEAGLQFWKLAIFQTGLYVLLPLALLGAFTRWASRRDMTFLLAALIIIPHAAYVTRIGGDHFEFRMMDHYWPLLTLAASEGICWAAMKLASALTLLAAPRNGAGTPDSAPAPFSLDAATRGAMEGYVRPIFVCLSVFMAAVTGVYLVFAQEIDHAPIDPSGGVSEKGDSIAIYRPPYVPYIPFARTIVASRDAAARYCRMHAIAIPQSDIGSATHTLIQRGEAFEKIPMPSGICAAQNGIGVVCFYLPDITFIDTWGLTDYVIARNPDVAPNESRHIAHDRTPPEGYLQSRGVQMMFPSMWPDLDSMNAWIWAPNRRFYLVECAAEHWLRFQVAPWTPRDWVTQTFEGHSAWQFCDIGMLFGGSVKGWKFDGMDASQQPIRAGEFVGLWPANVFSVASPHGEGSKDSCSALSPLFLSKGEARLYFELSGTPNTDAGIALMADDVVVSEWRVTHADATPELVRLDISPYAKKLLQLKLFDNSKDISKYVSISRMRYWYKIQ